MIFYAAPRIIQLDEDGCAVKIPLGFRTKNHLGSMYFGALCVGADCAGAATRPNPILRCSSPNTSTSTESPSR